jgi:hypothetical protein
MENLKNIIKNSKSWDEVCAKLGIKFHHQSVKNYRDKCIKQNINFDHFYIRKKPEFKTLDRLLIKGSRLTIGTTVLKNKIYKAGLKEKKCELCGQGEIWLGKKISLILDHIDGDTTNNELTNLRIVCPNCNASLDTFAGRNKKRKPIKIKVIKVKKIKIPKTKRLETLSNYKLLIPNLKIDWSKKGWGVELGKQLNKTPQYSIKIVKQLLPDLYQNCFKHEN